MNQNKLSLAPSARTSVFDLGACMIDAGCKIVFLLEQVELCPLPFALETITVQLELVNRPETHQNPSDAIPCSLSSVTFQFIWKLFCDSAISLQSNSQSESASQGERRLPSIRHRIFHRRAWRQLSNQGRRARSFPLEIQEQAVTIVEAHAIPGSRLIGARV
jgi:hypothetical protein